MSLIQCYLLNYFIRKRKILQLTTDINDCRFRVYEDIRGTLTTTKSKS